MSCPIPYYEEPGITIYHGDCREILPHLPKVDLVLTDPPYGIGVSRNERANTQYGKSRALCKDYGSSGWDNEPAPQWLIQQVLDKATYGIVWGGNYFSLGASSCWLVWDKDNGNNGYADCELAWTNLRKAVRRIRFKWMGMLQENMGDKKEERVHPAQKPLEVMKWALQQAPQDCAIILDPFMVKRARF